MEEIIITTMEVVIAKMMKMMLIITMNIAIKVRSMIVLVFKRTKMKT